MFVAAGFCAHGLAGAGGIGKVMAEWIAEGEPSLDVWEMDVRRFGAHYRSPAYTLKRDPRDLRDLLRHPLPQPRARGRAAAAALARQRVAPRPRRRLRREVRLGAGQLVRVERAPPATSRCARAAGRASTGRRRSAPSTSPPARRPALFDESSFAKMEIAGPGAAELLERLCDNRVARGVGQITYTQMLNRRGGIECDFTVARLGEERFSIVTGTAFGNHDREWIRRHLPDDGSVQVARRDLAVGLLRDLGPARARHPRAAHAAGPLDNEAFPYMTLREITVGDVPGAGAAGDLRRRARLGALLPDRVRPRAVAGAVGGGPAARHGRRRLPGDRLDAAREGLPRLGRRHHARRDPVRGRASASA